MFQPRVFAKYSCNSRNDKLFEYWLGYVLTLLEFPIVEHSIFEKNTSPCNLSKIKVVYSLKKFDFQEIIILISAYYTYKTSKVIWIKRINLADCKSFGLVGWIFCILKNVFLLYRESTSVSPIFVVIMLFIANSENIWTINGSLKYLLTQNHLHRKYLLLLGSRLFTFGYISKDSVI